MPPLATNVGFHGEAEVVRTLSNRRWRLTGESFKYLAGGRGGRPGVRQRRSRCRRCPGGVFGLRRLFRSHRGAGRLRRRGDGLKLRDHRIGIDPRRPRGKKTSLAAADPNRDRNRLEIIQGVTDREIGLGNGHVNGAGGLATLSHGSTGIGSRRRGLKLNLQGWRSRRK